MAQGKGLKEKKKILITDRITETAELYLKQFPFIEVAKTVSPTLSREELLGVHGLLIRSRTKIDSSLLKNARNLQVIVTCTSGFDHIDLSSAAKWGITVMHTPDANRDSAAELTIMHLMMLARKFPKTQVLIQSEIWKREHVVGQELTNKKLGIIGFGRIGRRVGSIARALGLQIFVYDPYVDSEILSQNHAHPRTLEQIFEQCDFVSLHVPKTRATTRMIDDKLLQRAKPGLCLINTSRGDILDEKAIVEAIQNGLLSGVGLDVFQQEPLLTSSPLYLLPEVILTPHIGANTEEAFEKASQIGSNQIVKFFEDGSTSSLLPPRAPWYFDEI